MCSLNWHIKDRLKAFDDFKNNQKGVKSNIFWYRKVCISWMYIQYTIDWGKSKTLKKVPSDKINGTKIASFFFREFQLITVLLLICNSYINWSTRFASLKLCIGFSIFHCVSFLLRFIFLFNKMHGLFDNVIIIFKIKTPEKPHTVWLPDLWSLSCNKKF